MTSGFDFTDEEIFSVQPGHLLSMEIEFSRRCNYVCSYCYASDPEYDYSHELTAEEIRSAIRQAREAGARKIIILGGEPLIYPDFFPMTDFIAKLGMKIQIFTNGSKVDDGVARKLSDRNVQVVVKLNTMDPEKHDVLTGVRGSWQASLNAFDALLRAGYDRKPGLIGGTTVLATANLGEAFSIWKYLRGRGIAPYFECITPQGRLLQNRELLPDPQDVKAVFQQIADYEKSQGRGFDPQPPLVGAKCFRHHYSCVVMSNGNVVPCVGLDSVIGNIREKPLAEILKESRIIRDLRNYRKLIAEPCRSCEKVSHCYGCRGTAWQMTGDHLAADPTCWFVDEFHKKTENRG